MLKISYQPICHFVEIKGIECLLNTGHLSMCIISECINFFLIRSLEKQRRITLIAMSKLGKA